MQATIYNLETGEEQVVDMAQAARLTAFNSGWTYEKPLPKGWDSEMPRYRATKDLEPAHHARYREEPPFAESSNQSAWQYGERKIKAGEIVETIAWPHLSFHPINPVAEKIYDHFMTYARSRMGRSPWCNGRMFLGEGLGEANPPFVSGPAVSSASNVVGSRPTRGARPRVA